MDTVAGTGTGPDCEAEIVGSWLPKLWIDRWSCLHMSVMEVITRSLIHVPTRLLVSLDNSAVTSVLIANCLAPKQISRTTVEVGRRPGYLIRRVCLSRMPNEAG
ncbi:unnamed protein product [Protopolystoma xenopodis]|uniref:Uncharacterized protein n=1 Tax=Protopolystoma xenopodis TaxID=117903 RepID=A0A448WZI6_9PLAT|nr:unnamed protein product [Protopolystoma xenopodis]